METHNEEETTTVFLDRSSRATRGKRMTKLLDEEIEQDELFWSQDALKEEAEDDNYEEEAEVADEFDSDFDDDEPEPDEGEENEVDERTQKKKRLIFPGKPSAKKKKKAKKVVSKSDGPSEDVRSTQRPATPDNHDASGDVEAERTVRKSTRTAVIVRQAERDAIRVALQATMKPIKRKKEVEEKRMTQEEMLLEAAQTEIMNLRNLERVLAREEEVKKRATAQKDVYSGPQICYTSKDGCSYLEFRGVSFQSQISTKSAPYSEKAVCAVTGLPAKYRDPKTGLPYATKEAFKVIRERFMAESNMKKEMDIGALFDSVHGKGFTGRRKRSPLPKNSKISYFLKLPYFRKHSPVEVDSSD